MLLLALGGLVLAAACVNVSTLLVARGRCAPPRLRPAPGARRQPPRHRRAVHRRGAAAVRDGGGRRHRRGVAVARRAPGAASLRPQSDGRARSAARRARILAATAGVSVVCALAFALLPALQASRIDLATAFQGGTRTLGSRTPILGACAACWPCRWRCRWSCSSAPACSRGPSPSLDAVDAGFDQRGLLLFRIDATSAGYADRSRGRAARPDPRAARRRCPACATSPTRASRCCRGRARTSRSCCLSSAPAKTRRAREHQRRRRRTSSRRWRCRSCAGAASSRPIATAAPKVAVVNETFARQQFGGADPIGRRIAFGAPAFDDVVEVVGVARDAKYTDLRGEAPPTIYLPAYQRVEGVGGLRGARRRRSRGADAGRAGGAARPRSDAAGPRSADAARADRAPARAASACSPGSRPSSASPPWRWRWPACTGCCRRRCSGGPASSGCGSRSARRRANVGGMIVARSGAAGHHRRRRRPRSPPRCWAGRSPRCCSASPRPIR